MHPLQRVAVTLILLTNTGVSIAAVAPGKPAGAEQRLKELGIQLAPGPEPFGIYAEAVQTGNLLFFSGMLPVVDHKPKYLGRVIFEVGE